MVKAIVIFSLYIIPAFINCEHELEPDCTEHYTDEARASFVPSSYRKYIPKYQTCEADIKVQNNFRIKIIFDQSDIIDDGKCLIEYFKIIDRDKLLTFKCKGSLPEFYVSKSNGLKVIYKTAEYRTDPIDYEIEYEEVEVRAPTTIPSKTTKIKCSSFDCNTDDKIPTKSEYFTQSTLIVNSRTFPTSTKHNIRLSSIPVCNEYFADEQAAKFAPDFVKKLYLLKYKNCSTQIKVNQHHQILIVFDNSKTFDKRGECLIESFRIYDGKNVNVFKCPSSLPESFLSPQGSNTIIVEYTTKEYKTGVVNYNIEYEIVEERQTPSTKIKTEITTSLTCHTTTSSTVNTNTKTDTVQTREFRTTLSQPQTTKLTAISTSYPGKATSLRTESVKTKTPTKVTLQTVSRKTENPTTMATTYFASIKTQCPRKMTTQTISSKPEKSTKAITQTISSKTERPTRKTTVAVFSKTENTELKTPKKPTAQVLSSKTKTYVSEITSGKQKNASTEAVSEYTETPTKTSIQNLTANSDQTLPNFTSKGESTRMLAKTTIAPIETSRASKMTSSEKTKATTIEVTTNVKKEPTSVASTKEPVKLDSTKTYISISSTKAETSISTVIKVLTMTTSTTKTEKDDSPYTVKTIASRSASTHVTKNPSPKVTINGKTGISLSYASPITLTKTKTLTNTIPRKHSTYFSILTTATTMKSSPIKTERRNTAYNTNTGNEFTSKITIQPKYSPRAEAIVSEKEKQRIMNDTYFVAFIFLGSIFLFIFLLDILLYTQQSGFIYLILKRKRPRPKPSGRYGSTMVQYTSF